jgi:predicted MFS family arabinose efflux permease
MESSTSWRSEPRLTHNRIEGAMPGDGETARLLNRPRAQLLLLTFVVMTATYSRLTVAPLQESVRATLELSDNQMGLLQGPALAAPAVITAIPLGLLIDRASRVRILVGLTIMTALAGWLTAAAPSFGFLLAARCVAGLAAFAANPVALSLIADLFAPARRGFATMAIAIGQAVGASAAFGLGGLLLMLAGSGGWRWAMAGLAVPALPAIIAALLLAEPKRRGNSTVRQSRQQMWRGLWNFRHIVGLLTIGMIAAEVALGAVYIWSAPVLAREYQVSPGSVGAILATVVLVAGLVGPAAGGGIADYCERVGGPVLTSRAVAVLSLPCLATSFFAFATGEIEAGLILGVFMTFVTSICVAGTTLFTVALPSEFRGLSVGVLCAACILCGNGLAPLLVSVLAGAFGGGHSLTFSLTVVGAASCLLAGAAFWRASNALRGHVMEVGPAM